MDKLRRVLAVLAPMGIALWTGAVLAVAFVAAPVVFAAVPEHIPTKDIAGRVIGPSFGRVDTAGIVAAGLGLVYLWLLPRSRARLWREIVLVLMLGAAIVNGTYLSPAITARQEPLDTYHAASVALWMLIIVGGLLLTAVGLRPVSKASR
ncbi:MAG: DUF4149 domain-containing protein [Planctomycetota bacterium]|nr:DUF4149 domain-containing protein [Planctomycetota bacterium]